MESGSVLCYMQQLLDVLTLGVAWHHPVGVVTTTIGMHINTMYHDTEVTDVVRLSESVTCHNNARAKYTCKKNQNCVLLKMLQLQRCIHTLALAPWTYQWLFVHVRVPVSLCMPYKQWIQHHIPHTHAVQQCVSYMFVVSCHNCPLPIHNRSPRVPRNFIYIQ